MPTCAPKVTDHDPSFAMASATSMEEVSSWARPP